MSTTNEFLSTKAYYFHGFFFCVQLNINVCECVFHVWRRCYAGTVEYGLLRTLNIIINNDETKSIIANSMHHTHMYIHICTTFISSSSCSSTTPLSVNAPHHGLHYSISLTTTSGLPSNHRPHSISTGIMNGLVIINIINIIVGTLYQCYSTKKSEHGTMYIPNIPQYILSLFCPHHLHSHSATHAHTTLKPNVMFSFR